MCVLARVVWSRFSGSEGFWSLSWVVLDGSVGSARGIWSLRKRKSGIMLEWLVLRIRAWLVVLSMKCFFLSSCSEKQLASLKARRWFKCPPPLSPSKTRAQMQQVCNMMLYVFDLNVSIRVARLCVCCFFALQSVLFELRWNREGGKKGKFAPSRANQVL